MAVSRSLLAFIGLVAALGWTRAGGEVASAPPPVLALPIDCQPGRTCFVQQYFDHDPGPGAKDYRCGSKVYDGHDGVDIRLPTIAAQQRGVAVLAAAGGVVKGVRDGEADRLVAVPADRTAIAGRECGNGVVIDHGGGWLTQYCHMAKGSIAVAAGQAVRAGDRLGLVGLSGDTQFPHVHLSVRRDGRDLDPFAPDLRAGSCGVAGAGKPLWTPAAAAALAYRTTEVINLGFAAKPVTQDDIDAENLAPPDAAAPAVVFYGRMIGLLGGDLLTVRLIDPAGRVLADNPVAIDRPKAQFMAMAGLRRPGGGWPHGRYRGTLTVTRGGRAELERSLDLTL